MFKMSNFTNSVFRGPNQVNMVFSYHIIINRFLLLSVKSPLGTFKCTCQGTFKSCHDISGNKF